MAAYFTWPPALPQVPQKGYSETQGALIIQTPMDAGPAKMRKRGNKPNALSVSFIMTTAEVDQLNAFIITTAGTARFYFPHPRTVANVEARMMPQGGGDLYTITYLAPGYYTVSMQLEVMPL